MPPIYGRVKTRDWAWFLAPFMEVYGSDLASIGRGAPFLRVMRGEYKP